MGVPLPQAGSYVGLAVGRLLVWIPWTEEVVHCLETLLGGRG
jgi:hypothetical protein